MEKEGFSKEHLELINAIGKFESIGEATAAVCYMLVSIVYGCSDTPQTLLDDLYLSMKKSLKDTEETEWTKKKGKSD